MRPILARPRRLLTLSAVLAAGAASAIAPAAFADGAGGADPSSNHPLGSMPAACTSAPTGAACEDAAVASLNAARAANGQPAYALQADFDTLAPEQQDLILTDLDRVQAGLPPIPGLTAALNSDAAAGAAGDRDPEPSETDLQGYTSNWAGGDGYPNLPAAYEGWMYDDGPGSPNEDCTVLHPAGCWGHRHDILWNFTSEAGPLAMGAATGTDHSGQPGYAMLIGAGGSGYQPAYTYTWAQAQADGAGGAAATTTTSSTPTTTTGTTPPKNATPAAVRLKVTATRKGTSVTITITAPAHTALSCRLKHNGAKATFKRCAAKTTYRHLAKGVYGVTVEGADQTAGTRFRIN